MSNPQVRTSRGRWRPMLRLAWRTALRSKGRTALVAMLVGLPVFAGVLVDVIVRANDVPGTAYARWRLGAADAKLEVTESDRISVNTLRNQRDIGYSPAEGAKPRDPRQVDVTALLPGGSRLIDTPSSARLRVQNGGLLAESPVLRLAGTDPMAEGITLLRSGRHPKAADEVAVSSSLGNRLDLLESGERPRANATVTTATAGTTARVVGVVDLPERLNAELLLVPPGSSLLPGGGRSGGTPSYLVDLPALNSAELHALADRLAEQGVMLAPRDAYVNPHAWLPPGLAESGPMTLDELQGLALGALCIGFGLLEVVLLAGAAFAVGARRQTRELGLIAASGGSPKDVRRVVLAQGVVLGLIGATAGAALALALPAATKPLVERVLNHQIDGLPFAPLDYAVLIAVGMLSGMTAAVIPAIGASRMTPVAALAGRFRVLGGPARPPKLAIALLAGGLAAGILGTALLNGTFAEIRRNVEQQKEIGFSTTSAAGDLSAPLSLCVLGFTLTAFGLVRLMPALMSWAGALGGRLPLSLRLAFRDGSRHRHRTGPAAAAVMIAVAASIGATFILAGGIAAGKATYTQIVPMGAGIVTFPDEQSPARLEKLRAAAEPALAKLPGTRTWQLRATEAKAHTPDIPLGGGAYGNLENAVWVAAPDFLDVLTDVPEAELGAAKRSLSAGQVVALSPHYVRKDGAVWIWPDPDGKPSRLPAHVVRLPGQYHDISPVIISPETADRLGWESKPAGLLVQGREPISQRTADLTNGALSRLNVRLEVERGYQSPNPLLPLIAIAAAGFVTLAGVAISVALSASEGRADLATLAAIGAQPRRRRSLAAAQALLVGGVGCLLGIGLGGFLAFAGQAAAGAPGIVVPWPNVLATAVVIPLFAALCAALFTRSELRMARRAE